MTPKAKRPVPASKTFEANAASDVKEKAPPVWASAVALLLAVTLAVALALDVALADTSGQTPSGSNAVSGFVPNNTLPPGLK
jgi:hypothetical protein